MIKGFETTYGGFQVCMDVNKHSISKVFVFFEIARAMKDRCVGYALGTLSIVFIVIVSSQH